MTLHIVHRTSSRAARRDVMNPKMREPGLYKLPVLVAEFGSSYLMTVSKHFERLWPGSSEIRREKNSAIKSERAVVTSRRQTARSDEPYIIYSA